MPSTAFHRAAALAVAAAFALPAAASAQTIEAVGLGRVAVPQDISRSEPSIRGAVRKAREAAIPLAVEAARQQAQRIAAASGLTLGGIVSVSENSGSPYGPFAFGVDGTFGPGRYCGTIRTPILRRDSQGRRRPTGRVRTRRTCRIPREAISVLAVTFDAR